MHIFWIVLQVLIWKTVTTWWPGAWSPQTYWLLRIDHDNPCDPAPWPHHQPENSTWTGTPLPHLPCEKACLNLLGEFGGVDHKLPWTPCLVPCKQCCTFLHQHCVSRLAWLLEGEQIQVWFNNPSLCNKASFSEHWEGLSLQDCFGELASFPRINL